MKEILLLDNKIDKIEILSTYREQKLTHIFLRVIQLTFWKIITISSFSLSSYEKGNYTGFHIPMSRFIKKFTVADALGIFEYNKGCSLQSEYNNNKISLSKAFNMSLNIAACGEPELIILASYLYAHLDGLKKELSEYGMLDDIIIFNLKG